MNVQDIHLAFLECLLCASSYERWLPFSAMASISQNVKNELVLSEPSQSSMEWIYEVTELHSHGFSCFCFFGVLDIGQLTS